MRIAIVYRDLSPRSGSRRFLYEVGHRLFKRGHAVKFFTNKLNLRTCFEEILTLPYQVVPAREQLGGRFTELFISLKAIKTGREAIMWKPNVVFAQYAGESTFPLYFHTVHHEAAVAYFHVIPRFLQNSKALFRKIYSWPIARLKKACLKKIDLVAVNSRFLAEKVQESGLPSSIPIEVVPLGVNHTKFHLVEDAEEKFVLCLSRIHPPKNLELVINAMEKVKSDAPLIIASSGGGVISWDESYKRELDALVRRLHLAKRVKFHRIRNDAEIVSLIQKSSVFLFPSMVDTFGVTALEAMACGKPVIACDSGGVPEVVGDTGFLLNPNPKEWAECIDNLLTDPKLRRDKGKEAFERSKLFSWDKTTDRLIEIFERLI